MAILLFGLFLMANKVLKNISIKKAWPLNRLIQAKVITTLMVFIVLHGLNTIKIILFISGSYWLGRISKGNRLNVVLTWSYNIGLLFAIEFCRNVDHHSIWPLQLLDRFFTIWSGFLPRWYTTFNITILRLISFNMDYYFAFQGYSVLQHRERCPECIASSEVDYPCERRRVQEPAEMDSYSFINFILYTLYPPLYAAGPIITFNNFHSQLLRPPKQETKSKILYGIRWIASFLLLDLMLHYLYVVAIKDNRTWMDFSALDFASLAYWNLTVVWLKLLIIWRFFRLISLWDGIVPQENMVRCMTNNFSGLAFWRSWHRSFNLWVIRYMYIPLGGTRTASYNIWPIFTFVAVWHDVRLQLLFWSWLICLFILPEIFLRWLAKKRDWESKPYYRQLSAAGAGANMFLMSVANLVGFVVGIDGIRSILTALFTSSGLIFTIGLFGTLYCLANILLEIRHTESYYGIKKNY